MEKIVHMKDAVLFWLAAVGSVLANMFGGWDVALQILVYVMAADYLTGLVVAGVFKRSPKSETGALESRAGLKGLFRKGGILLVVLVGVWLDKLLGAAYVRTAVCLFFIANEGLSIIENLGLMGVPLPGFLKKMLEAMRDKADSGEDNNV
ncbi:MAG TPA: phage holin family protein [Pseudoflavonifractor sp.]|nr:phage holin family protein [Pseudoflavonifractor sp.]